MRTETIESIHAALKSNVDCTKEVLFRSELQGKLMDSFDEAIGPSGETLRNAINAYTTASKIAAHALEDFEACYHLKH